MTRITFDHVTKSYDSVQPLKDVSFSIEPGEFFVLVGPSGCGKSTLLQKPAAARLGPHFGATWAAPATINVDGVRETIDRSSYAVIIDGRMYTVEARAPKGKLDAAGKAAARAVAANLAAAKTEAAPIPSDAAPADAPAADAPAPKEAAPAAEAAPADGAKPADDA
jgi:ATPase subunit of ABC transporter with duplicated ATPase domains